VDSNVQPIPLSDAIEAVVSTALRRAERELRKADVGRPDAVCSHSRRTTVAGVDVRVDVTVRGPECTTDVPALNPPAVWVSPSPTSDHETCAALRFEPASDALVG